MTSPQRESNGTEYDPFMVIRGEPHGAIRRAAIGGRGRWATTAHHEKRQLAVRR